MDEEDIAYFANMGIKVLNLKEGQRLVYKGFFLEFNVEKHIIQKKKRAVLKSFSEYLDSFEQNIKLHVV